MRVCAVAALVVAIAGLASLEAGPAVAQAGDPTGFSCAFTRGTTVTYRDGRFRTGPAKTLGFSIAEIDLEGQKAVIVTPAGRGQLRVVRALNANHYLEVIAEGFLNVTTVYDRDAKAGAHPAVHSRHFGLFGEPVVAQYRGFCKPA